MNNPRRQRGVALISVLLITALVTLIISDMLARQRLSVASSANQLQQQQLWQLALSGETWAREQLRSDLRADDGLTRVHLGQRWPQDGGELEIEGGRIRIHLEDLGARFNLDRLRNPNDELNRARYQRLLAQLGLPPHDPASLPTTAGYNHKPLPFADSSELRRLVALDFSGWQRLQPWVATTGLGALNINTASAQLLATLESLDLGIAQALVQQRPADGYKSVQEFLEQPLLQGRQVNGAGLTTSSSNFRATLEVALGERRLHLISDLRTGIDGQVQVLRRQLVAPLRTFSE
ncbi:type II secretion system minor pseudopilin GspK [Pseudomonas fragi]|uniref:type II secretion system minor pseudopilin GspK n=1 Tax=Pseudomonas fragi TaxID=296 RepID=UPI0021C239BD|nr:type II secretion system minor pseudopilin GspK [Pseudomonas fragi]UXL36705.1 type II secretion system minor pseudopilin GspK [Pseudomonas fragi]